MKYINILCGKKLVNFTPGSICICRWFYMANKLFASSPIPLNLFANISYALAHIVFFSWRDSPLVGLGLLHVHEDFCGF